MTIHDDDPRLTAYALGELDDAERAEVETELKQNEPLRKLVDDTRCVAGALKTGLTSQTSCLTLNASQRTAIQKAAALGRAPLKPLGTPAPPRPRRWPLYAAIGLATSLLLLAVAAFW